MVLTRLHWLIRLGAILGFVVCAKACAHVPFDAPRTPSMAFGSDVVGVPDVTRAIAREDAHQDPHESAYYELSNGTDALGARLRMIEAAANSIDIATFLIKPDTASRIIARHLVDAADRGVRVRLLVDDIFTTADDEDLAVLDANPNIEVRIFNPASRNAPKFLAFLWDFGRINRRMHIKTFVVDNAMAIVGGRNFADEYYELKQNEVFADYDLAVFGQDARDLNPVFDTYWNDRFSVPVANLRPKSAPSAVPLHLSDWHVDPAGKEAQAYSAASHSPYLRDISAGVRTPLWGVSDIIADTPQKLRNRNGVGPHALADAFFAALNQAKSQVTLITPYFVPEDYGAQFYADLAKRGVTLRVVTNTLSATNHAYVHGGYARHRADLLRAGVELYELRADAPAALGLVAAPDAPTVTLHTKLAIIDDTSVLVGSLNLDPRSIKTNAEIGLFVQSSAYAKRLLRELNSSLPQYTYRVTLDPDGRKKDSLIWTYAPTNDGPTTTTVSEPGATAWRRFMAALPQIFGLESLL